MSIKASDLRRGSAARDRHKPVLAETPRDSRGGLLRRARGRTLPDATEMARASRDESGATGRKRRTRSEEDREERVAMTRPWDP